MTKDEARKLAERVAETIEKNNVDWADEIFQALLAARAEAIEECAKVADDEGRSNVENPAIDMLEMSRRSGIRWCGEWTAKRIRLLAKEK